MVILGPVADIAMQKLTAEMPDQFEIAGENTGPTAALLWGAGSFDKTFPGRWGQSSLMAGLLRPLFVGSPWRCEHTRRQHTSNAGGRCPESILALFVQIEPQNPS